MKTLKSVFPLVQQFLIQKAPSDKQTPIIDVEQIIPAILSLQDQFFDAKALSAPS